MQSATNSGRNIESEKIVLIGAATTGKTLNYFLGNIVEKSKRITISRGFKYTYVDASGTFNLESGFLENFLITRIEGVIGE